MKINEIFNSLSNNAKLISELDEIIEQSHILHKDSYYKKNSNLIFIGNYISFLCFKHHTNSEQNLSFLIEKVSFNHFKQEQTICLDFKNNKNYNFDHIFGALNIKIIYNSETKQIILSHESTDYLLDLFFNKHLLNFEFFIYTNSSSLYTADYLLNIQPICKQLNIRLCSSILEHLLILNKNFCHKSVTSYFLNDKKVPAFLIEEVQNNFFSTNNQLWQEFKYKIPKVNGFYIDSYYGQLAQYLPNFINFSNKADTNAPLHPFFLNKKKIDRLVYFFNQSSTSFTLFFYNQIINEDIIIRKNIQRALKHNLTNLFLYVKNNKIELKDFVKFLEKNNNQPDVFWNIVLNEVFLQKPMTLKEIQQKVEQKIHNFNKSKLSCFKYFKNNCITELDSFEALAKEGERMKHCVKTKAHLLKYSHKFFHIKAGLFNRHSTLQICVTNDCWSIVMHNAVKNNTPSNKHKKIAQSLVDFLNQQ